MSRLLRVDGCENTALIMGAKFSTHSLGDTEGRRPADSMIRVTLLAHGGPWRQSFWTDDPAAPDVVFRLNSPGDLFGVAAQRTTSVVGRRDCHHDHGEHDSLLLSYYTLNKKKAFVNANVGRNDNQG